MKELFELSRAIQSCIVGAVGKPEQAYTAKLVSDLPQKANGIFKTRGFGFGGAFIHQRPCVTPVKETSGCELGDLLIFCHRNVQGEDRYNAQLLQLKKMGKGEGSVRVDPRTLQYRLYTEWPEFRMTRPKLPDLYDIDPKAATPGALYALIDENNADMCSIPICDRAFISNCCTLPRIAVVAPDPVMQFDCRFSLAVDIVAAMDWKSGRPVCKYEDLQGCQDRWSRLIWDLLWETLDAPFTCAAAGYPRTAKGNRLSKDLTAHLKWLKRCAQSGQVVEAPTFGKEVSGVSEGRGDEGFGLLIIDEGAGETA